MSAKTIVSVKPLHDDSAHIPYAGDKQETHVDALVGS